MSIPSSREEVATIARNQPPLRASSTSTRCSRASEPWCARVRFSPASSLSAPARRSAERRLLTNTIVERCVRMRSSSTGWIEGQIEAMSPAARSSRGPPTTARSSTGTMTSRSSCLRTPASTTATSRGVPGASKPPRNRATSSSGRWVADRPIRWNGRPVSASRRSSESMRWAPRLVAATEWISSRMTVWTPRRVSRAEDVSSRYSDSGVVIKMSGGSRSRRRRSRASVSPVRTPTVGTWGSGVPRVAAASWMPASGARRFFSMSTASARSGETYRTRVRSSRAGGGAAASRSIAHRNAASVLPDPVGASSSVCRPSAIGGHPAVWAGVGASNVASNHERAAGEKPCRLIGSRYPLPRTRAAAIAPSSARAASGWC